MNHAKNFKLSNIISRIFAFLIYFTAAGFAGVFCRTVFNSFMQIAFRNSPEIREIVLYSISLCAICGVLFFFSVREGFTDTENLRYSILKTALCYLISGVIFFTLAVCADIYIFGQGHFFEEYFLQYYYADEHISRFINHNFPENNISPESTESTESHGYILSAVFILLNTGAMTLAYKAGRNRWIKRKKKRLREMRENKI